jgi:hypothetical protein
VVVRIIAPVATLRRATLTPPSGAECRSVNLPESEPAEPAGPDWPCAHTAAPAHKTANTIGRIRLRIFWPMRVPDSGKAEEMRQMHPYRSARAGVRPKRDAASFAVGRAASCEGEVDTILCPIRAHEQACAPDFFGARRAA